MTKRRVLISSLLAAFALAAAASTAMAQIIIDPDPAKSTLQSQFIAVVGATNGLPDNCVDARCGNFTVTIRNWANDLMPGANVVINFSECSDIQISCDQLTEVTGQTYLSGKRVSGVTNAAGQFTFRVIGAATATSTPDNSTALGTNANAPCAQAYGDGVVLLPALVVSAYDINGLGSPNAAVNGADASLVVAEVVKVNLGAQARARDDYNFSGTVSGVDGSIAANMAAQTAVGTGSQNTGVFCP